MWAKVAMQTLTHTAVTVDHVAQWAAYLIAHRTAKTAASGYLISLIISNPSNKFNSH